MLHSGFTLPTFDFLVVHQLCFNHVQAKAQPYCRFCTLQWPQLFQIFPAPTSATEATVAAFQLPRISVILTSPNYSEKRHSKNYSPATLSYWTTWLVDRWYIANIAAAKIIVLSSNGRIAIHYWCCAISLRPKKIRILPHRLSKCDLKTAVRLVVANFSCTSAKPPPKFEISTGSRSTNWKLFLTLSQTGFFGLQNLGGGGGFAGRCYPFQNPFRWSFSESLSKIECLDTTLFSMETMARVIRWFLGFRFLTGNPNSKMKNLVESQQMYFS